MVRKSGNCDQAPLPPPFMVRSWFRGDVQHSAFHSHRITMLNSCNDLQPRRHRASGELPQMRQTRSVAWHTGASPADDIGSPIPHNGQKAYEISQPTDSSPIWLLPGSLARWLRYTFPRTRNEDELRLRAILILAIMAISAPAQQMPELRVSLRELTGEAIKNSPDIAAAQKRYEAARQRPTQESSLPDPKVSLGYNSVGNPLPGAGLGRDELANLGLMVSLGYNSVG